MPKKARVPFQMIQVRGLVCQRCGHQWIPRLPRIPAMCSRCKSRYFDTPRTKKTA
jgi:hypothetical protein